MGDVTFGLAAWSPMWVSVPGPIFLLGSLSRRVSVQVVSVQVVSVQGVSVQGGSVRDTSRTVKSRQYASYWNTFSFKFENELDIVISHINFISKPP